MDPLTGFFAALTAPAQRLTRRTFGVALTATLFCTYCFGAAVFDPCQVAPEDDYRFRGPYSYYDQQHLLNPFCKSTFCLLGGYFTPREQAKHFPLPIFAITAATDIANSRRDGKKPGILFIHVLTGDKTLLSVGEDGHARLWDLKSKKQVRCFAVGKADRGLTKIAISKNEKIIAIGNTRTGVEFHDLDSGKKVSTWAGACHALAFAPDSKTLAIANVLGDGYPSEQSTEIVMVDVKTGKQIQKIGLFPERGQMVKVSPRGTTLALRTTQEIVLISLKDRKVIHKWDCRPISIFYLPESEALGIHNNFNCAYPLDKSITMWGIEDGEVKRVFASDQVNLCGIREFSPDGKYLATYGPSFENISGIAIRQMPHGRRVLQVHGAFCPPWCTVFTSDNELLICGFEDGRILAWDIGDATCRGARPAYKVTEDRCYELWHSMGCSSTTTAVPAIDEFVEDPGCALRFLARNVSAVPELEVDKLIASLDSMNYKTRTAALNELIRLEYAAKPFIDKAMKTPPSLEVLARLRLLANCFQAKNHKAEWISSWNAVVVLEQIGTPEAVRFLEKLAAGAKGARLTEYAQAALRRMRVVSAPQK